MMNLKKTKYTFNNPVLWSVFIIYLIISGYTIFNHELWLDEIHSWSIAKGSGSFLDLINNTRYEGHPPLWYTIMWLLSKFTHDLSYLQAIHFIIASFIIFLILFRSPLPIVQKMLLPFGYFFLYEYAAISRNYAIGVLLAFCICIIMRKSFKHKSILYYTLLFLLSNTHLLGLILAASFHVYFLLLQIENRIKTRSIVLHVCTGLLISLPAIYFIFPPSDSELNMDFWLNRWDFPRVLAFGQSPLLSFFPVPAWWNYNSWNTQFLLEAKNEYGVLRFINFFISIAILVSAFFILKANKKSAMLFATNFLLSLIVSVVIFSLNSPRYSGFLFISLVVSYWLHCYEFTPLRKQQLLFNILLSIQIIAAVFSISKDIRFPFSNSYKVNELIREVPENELLVTDYRGLITVKAFTNKSLYCIDLQKEVAFVLWNKDIVAVYKNPNRYCNGVESLFQKQKIEKLYIISTSSPEVLANADVQLFNEFTVKLVDKREGAIEKGSNLYLYEINSK